MSTLIEFDPIEISAEELETKFVDFMFIGHGGITRRIGLAVLSNSVPLSP